MVGGLLDGGAGRHLLRIVALQHCRRDTLIPIGERLGRVFHIRRFASSADRVMITRTRSPIWSRKAGPTSWWARLGRQNKCASCSGRLTAVFRLVHGPRENAPIGAVEVKECGLTKSSGYVCGEPEE